MSTSVNTIKWLLGVLLGEIILTYLISLNMENHFVAVNTKWLSNDFLFAIAAGALASLLIVLVCEVIRYRQLKFATEAVLFSNLGNLYGQFLIIRSSCKRVLNNHALVADNLIQPISNSAAIFADSINNIDYTPLCNKNKINEIIAQFKSEKHQVLKSVLTSFIYYQIAIHEDKIIMEKQGIHGGVTSDGPNVNQALNKVINQSTTILTYLDQIISQFDSELDNRYNWLNVKQSMNTFQENFIEQRLEDYLKDDVIVF